ncbi:hypothetical protein [Kribbella sp. HUAS MG21]|uniref:Uncharacterized protein n=1 Tax=Kribbella sp. HUAS MG21 TaxID=3160966 RepID=A0AAU7T9P1_9ACTN
MALCLPMPDGGGDVALGHDVVRNQGSEPATITRVSAVDAEGLRVAEAVAVAIDDQTLFGVWTAWPPRSVKEPVKAAQWRTRRPALGYVLPPAATTTVNLVVHVVKDPGVGEATMRALRVDYSVGERSYFAETTVRIALKPRCS